ncbi:MAG: hypothetical protein EPN62_14445 [Candidimonas sp.]|nr:MAG: hypothetical protein EPN77_03865 [Candidimonas sp.]TAM21276.1 MAG: hypothetical protein EPN62_14445 [Candidimonas sp.]
MPQTVAASVRDLVIDLENFRTVAQPDDMHAIQAMITIDSDKFWALMESLIDDGYLPTENIIVLKSGPENTELLVKEGNRRVAALKLIHGYLPAHDIAIPNELLEKISALSPNWKSENERLPCAIYPAKDAAVVDKIVTLTHGKGENAGRAPWNAVARARHNRSSKKAAEHGLDLLEKYLEYGENLNRLQAKRWAGDYNLSVLDEAIGKIASTFGVRSGPELARNYPAINHKSALDEIMQDIGVGIITFTTLRTKRDSLMAYLPQPQKDSQSSTATSPKSLTTTRPKSAASNTVIGSSPSNGTGSTTTQMASSTPGGANPINQSTTSTTGKKIAAVAIGDPRVVMRILKKFAPLGNNRQKVVTLRNEATRLKLDKNPIAFCFLLRSMFEISAKAYCADHQATGGPSLKKPNGDEKSLITNLKDITNHITDNNSDKTMVKVLHGAITELARQDGFLSVTSMNQLVHNPSFLVTPSDIATLFGNIYPLLETMNS